MTVGTARKAIQNHAYELTIQTSADHYSVSGCFRRNARRVACHVTVYEIPANGQLVDCSFYSHAFYVGNSRRVHLGDTKPICRLA